MSEKYLFVGGTQDGSVMVVNSDNRVQKVCFEIDGMALGVNFRQKPAKVTRKSEWYHKQRFSTGEKIFEAFVIEGMPEKEAVERINQHMDKLE